MDELKSMQQDLSSIRNLMERSNKFISLSGLSGILAGIYALGGAVYSYFILYYPNSPFGYRIKYVNDVTILNKLIIAAAVVLLLSISSAILLSYKKAAKNGESLLNKNSKILFISFCVPLFSGGLFTLVLLFRGYLGIVAPATLLFYGLALINASNATLSEIKGLGYLQISLGLISALLPGYGLLLWATGFGVIHIIYGALMYQKYDK
ncbi:MAG: hypothetical protein MUC81_03335 [Bacteroidia bacterium]|jgi:hypothetical protein|nr:hypothetical protein [Bacteroidia bacterium]